SDLRRSGCNALQTPSRSSSSTSMASSSTGRSGDQAYKNKVTKRTRRILVETATQERTSRAFEQTTAKPNGDAAAFSIGVTQGVIGPLTDLAIVAAKENARLAAELQAVALDALHESQATVLRPPPVESGGLLERVRDLEHTPLVLVTPDDL